MNGILFTPGNIVATREKRKTMTRRLDHLKEINEEPNDWWLVASFDDNTLFRFANDKLDKDLMIKPRYRMGETVYLKEPWHIERTNRSLPPKNDELVKVIFADGAYIEKQWGSICCNPKGIFLVSVARSYQTGMWQSPMFLPELCARTFIKITDTRGERLQNITETDARAEGASFLHIVKNPPLLYPDVVGYRRGFLFLWDSINGKTYPWKLNPWVWVYSYELQEGK